MDKDRIIVVAGPTAVGKTEYAIEIAKALDGEIVGCDSMQLYKYLDIGSAKPTPEERAAVPHHLVDLIDPREEFSVVRYRELAEEAIAEIESRGKVPVIAGGTGLYLDSLLYEMDFGPAAKNDAFRAEMLELAEREGSEALHARLEAIDPEAAERIHPHNVKRVLRALEAAEAYGEPLGDFRRAREPKKGRTAHLIGLMRERQQLYDRIDLRVDLLMEQGLEEEVKGLMAMGFTSADISMKGIGYKELMDHYEGAYSLEEAVRLIKRNSRRYAKRQMTWFRRYEDMQWFDVGRPKEDVLKEMLDWLYKRQ